MQIPIKIPTGSIQDKEIEYFTFTPALKALVSAKFSIFPP
jgi:hypothetical protein